MATIMNTQVLTPLNVPWGWAQWRCIVSVEFNLLIRKKMHKTLLLLWQADGVYGLEHESNL